jgi:hypothetical protein
MRTTANTIVILACLNWLAYADSNDWAVSVLAYTHPAANPVYTNPVSALGPAAMTTEGDTGTVNVTVTEPAWSPSQVVTIGNGGELVLAMGTVVTNEDDAIHPFGVDLIVYGNTLFGVRSGATPHTSPWVASSADPGEIWVASETDAWLRASGVNADALLPTQAIDLNGAASDYHYPVDPALLTNNWFDGTWSYSNTVAAYAGSAGGAPVDLSHLLSAGGMPTNLAYARYVKIVDIAGDFLEPEVDAVARVLPLPEPAGLWALTIGALLRHATRGRFQRS